MDTQQEGMLHIELGRTYRDKITEFQGVATACIHRIGGAIELILEGPDSQDRNRAEGYKFDWFRLELVDQEPVELVYPAAKTLVHEHDLSSADMLAGAGATS